MKMGKYRTPWKLKIRKEIKGRKGEKVIIEDAYGANVLTWHTYAHGEWRKEAAEALVRLVNETFGKEAAQ